MAMDNSKTFFYLRVSSKGQSMERQVAASEQYRKDNNIKKGQYEEFKEYASGKDFNRPQYQIMKKQMRQGDLLVIMSLDRLGRNRNMVLQEWQWFVENGIDIAVMDMELLNTKKYKVVNEKGETTSNFVADLVLQVLTYVADQERVSILERQKQGIAAAKSRGQHLGRPKKNYDSFTKEEKKEFELQYNRWKRGEQTAVRTYEELKLPKATFYRIVKEYEQLLESN